MKVSNAVKRPTVWACASRVSAPLFPGRAQAPRSLWGSRGADVGKLFWTISLSAAALLSGCGGDDGPVKYEVTGLVTFDGKPLDDGEIRFLPEDGHGTVGATRIKDGEFTLMSEAGTKRVEIRSAKERDAGGKLPFELPGGMQMPANFRFETIPKKYNQESTLTADVTSDGDNHFEFRLEK